MGRQVLKPILAPGMTRRGYFVFWFLYFWVCFWVIASGFAGTYSHTVPEGFMPNPTMMTLALLGMAIWIAIRFGWRLPGIRRLYPAPRAMAIVSPEGLELHIPSVGIRRYRWDEIGGLVPGPRWTGVLRSPNAQDLVSIPPTLLRGNWRSLALMVVRARGDRYVAFRSGLLDRLGPPLYLRSR